MKIAKRRYIHRAVNAFMRRLPELAWRAKLDVMELGSAFLKLRAAIHVYNSPNH